MLRILNYAINGIGVGHLTRLRSLSQWIRRLAPEYGVCAEISFITTSDADALLAQDGFPTFKVPSRFTLPAARETRKMYEEAARKCVRSIVETLRPTLLVVDSIPEGSFDEFVATPEIDILGLSDRRVFIYRPTKMQAAINASFQTALRRYDLILVPEKRGTCTIHIPSDLSAGVEWVGPIVSCDTSALLDRQSALQSLGLQDSALRIYVSFGGGGHPHAEGRIETICRALSQCSDVQVLVGSGPLYRGKQVSLQNVIWVQNREMASHLLAMDIAVSSAGYNSFNELMMAGIPTIFMPVEAPMDDQWHRARRAERAGAAVVLTEPFEESLRVALERWREPRARQEAAAAARSLVPENCARFAAKRLLDLAITNSATPAVTPIS